MKECVLLASDSSVSVTGKVSIPSVSFYIPLPWALQVLKKHPLDELVEASKHLLHTPSCSHPFPER